MTHPRAALSLLLLALLAIVPALRVHAAGHANLHRLWEQQQERDMLRAAAAENAASPASARASNIHSLQQLTVAESSSLPALSAASSNNVTTSWFEQQLDHFEFIAPGQPRRTFQQRYYSNFHFYRSGGPVFLYIGGEAELRNSSIDRGEIVDFARSHGGALFGLEHRFYGRTQPFPTLASENLKYLTVEQALEDAANFIGAMNELYGFGSKNGRGKKEPRWFVVGGSYPGALSAFMRGKYPHLVEGSLASSAPVHAQTSFWEYDAVVSQQAGPQCSAAIRNATAAVEALLDSKQGPAVKALFGCEAVPDNEDVSFLYVLADAVSYAVQYTSSTPSSASFHLKELMCDAYMLNQTATGLDPVHSFAGFFNTLMNRLNETCTTFSTLPALLNDTSTAPELNQRQWYWQSCLQFGFFQTAPNSSIQGQPLPIRSERITLQYHLDLCKQVYGFQMDPDVAGTNRRYGGIDPVGSRIYYVSGSVDPWRALSLVQNVSCCSSLVARTINGTAHCADLYPADPADNPDLTSTRAAIAAQVAEWIDPRNQNIDCPDADEGVQSCAGVCTDTRTDVRHCGSCHPAPEQRVDASNETDFYCRDGELFPVESHGDSLFTSQEMLALGFTVLVIGFVALAMGLHALRKVAVLRQLQKVEALERGQLVPSIAVGGGGGQTASTPSSAAVGHAAPSGRVPNSPRMQPAGSEHGWNDKLNRPLRSDEAAW